MVGPEASISSLNAAAVRARLPIPARQPSDGQGKEEACTRRALALLHQLAGDVIDRSDIVGIDRVAETESVTRGRSPRQSLAIAAAASASQHTTCGFSLPMGMKSTVKTHTQI
jgi:hypothetical protein